MQKSLLSSPKAGNSKTMKVEDTVHEVELFESLRHSAIVEAVFIW